MKENNGQTSPRIYPLTTMRFLKDKSEERRKSSIFKNDKLSQFLTLINKNENYDSEDFHSIFNEFKYFNFKNKWKEAINDEYIEKFILPKFSLLFQNILDRLQQENENKKNEENINIKNYSFSFLIKNMSNELNNIEEFFAIFDYIKKELDDIDYNLFIKKFLDKMKIKGNLVDKWRFINKIYMMKIYKEINAISSHKKKEKLSILNKNNNLCKAILYNIIDTNYFECEYFYGLFDYIYFQDIFIIDDNNEKKDLGLYDKFKNFHDNLYFLNDNSYYYIYESLKAKSIETNDEEEWNEFIKEEYKSKKFNIIYRVFNYLDYNNYKCRKHFYFKIFEKINKESDIYLDNIEFINGIIALIVEDKYHIFEIFSNDVKKKAKGRKKEFYIETMRKKYIQKMFESLIKKIIKRILDFQNKSAEKNTLISLINKNREIEVINSLILLIKLFGEYNNNMFHEIISKNLNEDNKINNKSKDNLIDNNEKNDKNYKLVVIEKLFSLYNEFIPLFNDLKGKDNSLFNEKMKLWENLLIVFHSLIKCITEYTSINYIEENNLFTSKQREIMEAEAQDIFLEKLIIKYQIKEVNDEEIQTIEEENFNKCFFILNCFTLLDVFRVKYLFIEVYLKFLCTKTITLIYIYFKIILYYNQNDLFKLRMDKIKVDKNTLLKLYLENRIENKQIFNSILLNYYLTFLITEIPGYEQINSLFYINNENNIENITKLLNNNDFINGDGKELLILFSFLQEIHDILEIRISEDKTINILNTLTPENFRLKKYSYFYYSNLIDYTDRETKLSSLYQYIECFIYDMKKRKYPIDNWINFSFFETINFLGILVENIFLIIFYSKSTENSIENYNKIDNRQDFSKFSIIIGIIHILFLFLAILYWICFRADVDYFYSFKYYKKQNLSKNFLTLDEKAKLLKRKDIKMKDFFSKISLFTFQVNKYCQNDHIIKMFDWLKDKLMINNIYNFCALMTYVLNTIYPFIISLICLILFLFGFQIALVIPLLLVFNLFETLAGIIKSLFQQSMTLLLIALYMIIVLYFFNWIGFFYIPQMFKYEPVDKNNEPIEFEENICSSAISCILYFWNYGMTSEGSLDINLVSFKNHTRYYLGQFFFDLFLYASIHMIFFNVFLATITDGFGNMRDQLMEINDSKKNSCFICQKTRSDCINDFDDFEEHLNLHNKWKYIMLIVNIILKDKKELNNEEYFIYQKIKEKKIDWFPRYKTD